MLPDHMKFSANEPLFVEMNFYISYRIEKQSVRRRSDFAALRYVLELTQNMRNHLIDLVQVTKRFWLLHHVLELKQNMRNLITWINGTKSLFFNDNSNEEKSVLELKQNMRNLITSINGMKFTANDNSNEEKSTIKVILVAARNVMKPLSGLQLLLH